MRLLVSDPPARPTGASSARDVSGAEPIRFLSRDACEALFKRIAGMTTGGGDTSVTIRVSWTANLRWARNRPTSAEVVHNTRVLIQRAREGAVARIRTTKLDDASLKQAIDQADQRFKGSVRTGEEMPGAQKYATSPLWSDATFNATLPTLSKAAEAGVEPIRAATLLAAGFAETRVETWAIFNTRGLAAYAAGTLGSYSETVRHPEGIGSGWAGLTHPDWAKLDIAQLSARALSKCKASISPRAIEPGRYTAILEPQVVMRFMTFAVAALDRDQAEQGAGPFAGAKAGETKIGQKVLDERITISTDPADPGTPYIPFDAEGYPFRPVTWIEKGVLKELAYDVRYAREKLKTEVSLPNPDMFRMSGGTASIEEMIATTERGLLMTNSGPARQLDDKSLLLSMVTRDGLWLIEKGKIKFPVKNMYILESPMFIGNSVEQLGKPERTFGGYWHDFRVETFPPMAFGNMSSVVPPMKVRDCNFASMTDAV